MDKEMYCPKTGNEATYKKCVKCPYVMEISAIRKSKKAKRFETLTGIICRPPRRKKDLRVKKGDKTLYKTPLMFLGDLK